MTLTLDDARISDSARAAVAAFILECSLEGFTLTLELEKGFNGRLLASFMCEGVEFERNETMHNGSGGSIDNAVLAALRGWNVDALPF